MRCAFLRGYDVTWRSIGRLAICVALCLGVGFVNGMVTYPEIPTWYATLVKPSWTPPNWAFPVVWNILYLMMAVSIWLMWDRPGEAGSGVPIALFLVQLALNAAWSPVFFAGHHARVALAIIVALGIAIAATIAGAWRVQRTAALLLVPYLAWVIYATSLNAGVVAFNP
jgi:translocator protein